MRLGEPGGIAAHQRTRALLQTERLGDRNRKPGDLVGDDAPANLRPVEPVEQRRNAFEQPRLGKHARFVTTQELIAQRVECRLSGSDAEGSAHHAAGATSDHGTQRLEIERHHSTVHAHVVGCASQVRRAVDQRAVEIEEQCDTVHDSCGRRIDSR